MTEVRTSLRFILNGEDIVLDQLPATQTLLDFLRLEQRLRGSKEGCAEGDCGACTVLVGRLRDGELRYETVNACICFVGSLDGTHVVTVEHLSPIDGPLHPVQQAMVDNHGSQCGFCTPGIVMSLYGLWMQEPQPVDRRRSRRRCRAISAAAPAIRPSSGRRRPLPPTASRRPIRCWSSARRSRPGCRRCRTAAASRSARAGTGSSFPPPSTTSPRSTRRTPAATLVSGATDVGLWVTKFMRDIGPIIFIGEVPELHRIENSGGEIRLGAGVTYTEAEATIGAHFPQLSELWNRIGGEQVRNMGTIGANIANGSPIGDTPPPLIALGASIVLRQGDARRTVQARGFLHRLWQAGPAARRVRRDASSSRTCPPASSSPATRSPSAATRTSRRSAAPSG